MGWPSRTPEPRSAAAIGLVLFFVCAVYTHLRAGDYYTPQLGLAVGFLGLAVAALALGLPSTLGAA
jgi:DoxX-like family